MKANLNSEERVMLTVAPTGGLHGGEANAALVERAVRIIRELGRGVASVDEARRRHRIAPMRAEQPVGA